MATTSTTMAQNLKAVAASIGGAMTGDLMTRGEGSTSGRVGTTTGLSTPAERAVIVRQSGRSGTAAESWTSTAAS